MSTPAGHPPICRDCVHYRPSHLAIYPRCARSASHRANLVTGEAEEVGLLPAEVERMSERAGHLLPANRCTEAGLFFVPAPKVDRVPPRSRSDWAWAAAFAVFAMFVLLLAAFGSLQIAETFSK